MDLSKEYIAMCEKANTELNPYWKWDSNYVFAYDGIIYCYSDMPKDTTPKYHKIVWLPRQDQLQEIDNRGPLHMKEVAEFADDLQLSSLDNIWFGTFEKTWLLFVMEIKFKKYWSGKAWVTLGEKSD